MLIMFIVTCSLIRVLTWHGHYEQYIVCLTTCFCLWSNLAEVDSDVSRHFHSVRLAVPDGVGHSGRGNEGLRRHAADVQAVAAHKVVFYQSHLSKKSAEK